MARAKESTTPAAKPREASGSASPGAISSLNRSMEPGDVTDHYRIRVEAGVRANVEARDLPHLYRVKSWLAAGIATGGGTDAPFGRPDPWRSMRAAVERRTPQGFVLGPDERVFPETALALFQSAFARAEQAADETAPALQVGAIADDDHT